MAVIDAGVTRGACRGGGDAKVALEVPEGSHDDAGVLLSRVSAEPRPVREGEDGTEAVFDALTSLAFADGPLARDDGVRRGPSTHRPHPLEEASLPVA